MLAINVPVQRGKHKILVEDGNNLQMLRMVRIHANAAEYVPIALVLMLAYGIDEGSHLILHALGIALVVGARAACVGIVAKRPTEFGARCRSKSNLARDRRPRGI